ncbi:DUF881 domain-containing protein [Tessaracoccus sp. OH4464_COT-324]|uniref:DUF881 domain-containing protein n=1 Tax=Tessaracoccus sp. OH4464_COT-324 TaxID=2491059 RepID=UPI000F6341FF|nr:DUF881 domain-containing protein [Tessaracoccus sp. OH4464_COT-324]RRD48025.1 DUF881 domain-containing protein [Tessaracoccus sp. OH4464_COT-324]
MTRRPDASMSLLRTLTEEALEPEYAATTAPRRTPWLTATVFGLLAALLVLAAVETLSSRDVRSAERDALVAQLREANEHQEQLAGQIAHREERIRELQLAALPDERQRSRLAHAELLAGAVGVSGPGVVITVDDALNATPALGHVLDSDLTVLVNGLFEAGAEAVSINGIRVSTRTPIRQAGAAITVDYVSLRPPYRVEGLGNSAQLASRFARTWAGEWWRTLHLNYGLRLDVLPVDFVELAADPGLGLRHAKKG